MSEPCELVYDSGNKRIWIFGCFTALSVLGILMTSFTALFIFSSICSAFGTIVARQNFRELQLYNDHIRLVDISGNVQWQVYYTDILRVGFLDGMETYSANVGSNMSNQVDTEILVILLSNKRSVEVDGNDFEEIHEVCTFIQNKIDAG